MTRYLKLWYRWSVYSAEIALQSRFGALLFVIGKFIRFGLFLFFIVLISHRVQIVGGYTLWQVIFLYATFNFIDTLAQFFLREVYRFRYYVITGEMDYFLVKPVSPLIRFLFGGGDILDFPLLITSIIFLVFGILTSEVENTLWLYRDLTAMGRIPIDLYKEPIRWVVTFVIPVGIMMTFPVKAILGKLDLGLILFSITLSLGLFIFSLYSWKFALRRYSSASS